MKALEELTREIREKIPRLKELSEGQRLLTIISDEPNDIYEGAFETIGIGAELLENGNIEIGGYEYEIGKSFEIVGKDPMLNDVLEWFKKSDMKDDINMMYEWIWIDTVKEILNLWNLSNPYLKNQSPELINFLHGLINH